MGVEYQTVDWPECLEVLVPSASYTRSNSLRDQDSYDNFVTWTDGRTKPTWAQIIAVWVSFNTAGSGVLVDPLAPGDRKFSPASADHGNWLYIPDTGRTLNRVDYAMLFNVIGTTYNSLYPGIAGTDFGLPKGFVGRTPVFTGTGYAYGATGGATSQTLTMANIPEHNHGVNSNILIAGSALALGGLTALLGTLVTKLTPATTSNAGSASPTSVSIMQPYLSFGNLFIYKGALRHSEFFY